MGDPIFPTDFEYLLETSDVKSFKGLDVFPICCPGLTTVDKDRNTYCMVHCNFSFCLQVTISKIVITQPFNGSVVWDDTAQVTE